MKSLLRYLMQAERITIFTGAGISTSCGIPDYRGPQGVWKTRKPVFYQEFMASEEARITYWQQKAVDFAEFKSASPSASHRAIVQLWNAGCLRLCITQNVDRLHSLAGLPDEALVEIHGNSREGECQTCGYREDALPHYEACLNKPYCPTCPECDGVLKPAVISFGQSLRPEDLQRAQEAMFDTDLVIAMGSTLSVQPAASFPVVAARSGIPYIVINKGPTEHDQQAFVSLRLEEDIDAVFPETVAEALAMRG